MDQLKSKRKSQRSLLTKLISETEAALDRDGVSLKDYVTFHDRVTAMSTELKQTDRDIEPHLMGQDMEQEYLRTAEYNDKTVTCLSKLSQRINELRAAATVSSAASPEPVPPRRASHGFKLPRIHLPKFDGRPRNWNPFWEQFESTVHNNPTLTDSDKFAYLRSSLVGTASAAIAGLTATSRCYKDARDILVDRFAKSDLIVQDHTENLIDMQPVRSSEDVLGLRRLYDTSGTYPWTKGLTRRRGLFLYCAPPLDFSETSKRPHF